jgi:23S rRNA U2552 (ribose-2'-O)-methylase RlmE/FtsJ
MSELQRDVPTSTIPDAVFKPTKVVIQFLIKNSPKFARLEVARKKVGLIRSGYNISVLIILQGWDNEAGDAWFKKTRMMADKANSTDRQRFFFMMKDIGDEMQQQTAALTPGTCGMNIFRVLDLCMAPGGYTSAAIKYNPSALACGITLPVSQGGHEILVSKSRVDIKELDITMLTAEMDCNKIPSSHPDASSFLTGPIFPYERFQLVFCDGQVLRTHERSEHRESFEARRLMTSQLVLALNRILPGGTLVVLLHKCEAWDTLKLLQQFDSFADIQLFKPAKIHAIRSSFYLIAKNVQPEADTAKAALRDWKQSWYHATFGGEKGTGDWQPAVEVDVVKKSLDEFGPRLIKLADNIWNIQANALERKDWNKPPPRTSHSKKSLSQKWY